MNKKRRIGKKIFSIQVISIQMISIQMISILLSLTLLCSLLSDSLLVLAEEERIVYISSVEDLINAAKQCRLDTYSQKKRFELTEDLNLSTVAFEGFATFGGTFHGNGHTISGIQADYQGSNQGFFRYIQEDGKIEDLNLIGNAVFSGSSTNAGMLAGVNRGTIRSCSVTISAKGENTIGGIAGINEGTGIIDRCMVRGSIAGEHNTGGIAGKNLGVITRCTNYASINTSVEEATLGLDEINLEQLNSTENISTSTDTGGIAGFSSGSITDSTNRGRIGYPHVGYNIGGIVGRQSGYIENCKNYGTIHGRKDVAGIVGQLEPYLLLQYSEDVVQKLESAFDQLDIAMNQLLDDVDLSSDNLRGHLDQVLDLMDLVRADFTDLTNQTVDFANELTDSANDMTERIDLALNRTHGVLDTMQGASDYLTRALEKIEDAIEDLDDVTDDGSIIFSSLQESIEELSNASSHLATAIKDAKNVQDILQKKIKIEIPTTSEPEETASNEPINGETTNNETTGNEGTTSGTNESETMPAESTTKPEQIPETESVPETEEIPEVQSGFEKGNVGKIPSLGGSELESIHVELETITLPNQDELESISRDLETITLPHQDELESISKELESIIIPENSIRSFLLRYFTEEELKSLEENLTHMGDQLQYASNALSRAFWDSDDLQPYLNSMSKSGNEAERNLADAIEYMEHASSSISDAFDKADTIIDALEGNQAVSFPKLDSSYQSLIDSISDLCDRILDVLRAFHSDTNSNSDRITGDIRRINNAISNVEDIIVDALRDLQEDKEEEETDENGSRIFEEVTSEEAENILQGKIKNTENYGTVEADIAVGGIAGNMAIEYDLDPEEDIHIQGEISLNFQYKTSTVLSDSVNYGTIVAKKDYAGGIIGKMDLGTVRNCQSYGNISSEGGKYIGGIAGSSKALIEDSYVRCRLTGDQYVGGIAGSAYDLNHCYALIQIEEATEFYGAIAGDAAKHGELYENYFVSGDWDGIDRISYAKMAMPISYEEMIQAEGFPKKFTEFLLTFVADDIIVAEIPFHYGDSLSGEQIPVVPAKDGYYANWEEFDYENMEFNEVIEAVYTKELTVISSEEKAENGKIALFLLEGIFNEDASVTVQDIRESAKISLKEKEHLLSGWHIEVSNPRQEEMHYMAHIVKPEGAKAVQLWRQEDGVWTEMEYRESGSYLIFAMDGNAADICLLEIKDSPQIILGIAAGAVILVGVVILMRKRRKNGVKHKAGASGNRAA